MTSKNIVLCLDGTGNEIERNATNVLRLHACLEQSDAQLCFYDPGVGTFSVGSPFSEPGRKLRMTLGLAFAYGLRENVLQAYRFLIDHWQDGDSIYIFGFSRGAYTARVVAAMVKEFGILDPEARHLAGYALRLLQQKPPTTYDAKTPELRIRSKFARKFGRDRSGNRLVVGVWDTVSSVSWIFDPQKYRHTAKNDRVDVFRHAVAIDERRAFFRTNLATPCDGQDFKEVWFAGVHCDVGGGYPAEHGGLSKIALEWMMQEANAAGLRIDQDKAGRLLGDDDPPRANAKMHKSLKGPWWACEFWPKLPRRAGFQLPRLNLAAPRRITARAGRSPCIHVSVRARLAADPELAQRLPEQVTWEGSPTTDGDVAWQSWPDGEARNSSSCPGPIDARESVSVLQRVTGVLSVLVGLPFLVALLWTAARFGFAPLHASVETLWAGAVGLYEFVKLLLPLLVWAGGFLLSARLFLGNLAPLDGASRALAEQDPPLRFPHMRFGYSAGDVLKVFEALGKRGRAAYARHFRWDFAFMLVYGGIFYFATWLVDAEALLQGLLAPMLWMGIGIVADVLENTCLLLALASHGKSENKTRRAAQFGAIATIAKFCAIGAATALLTWSAICDQ